MFEEREEKKNWYIALITTEHKVVFSHEFILIKFTNRRLAPFLEIFIYFLFFILFYHGCKKKRKKGNNSQKKKYFVTLCIR